MKILNAKSLILVLVLIAIFYFYFSDSHKLLEFEMIKRNLDLIKDSYRVRPLKTLTLFSGLYVLLTSLSIPGSIVLTLLSGTIFGVIYGTLIVTLSGSIGATIAFFLARYLFRESILKRFEKKYKIIDKKFRENGKSYLFSLRLLPASPFVIINLLMGLTSIRPWSYFWITFTGMLPGGLIYVYAGRKISEINSPAEILTWPIILLLSVLGVLPFIFKYLSQALDRKKENLKIRRDYI